MAATHILALKRHTENPLLPEETDLQLDGLWSVLGIRYIDFHFSYSKINDQALLRRFLPICKLFPLFFPRLHRPTAVLEN